MAAITVAIPGAGIHQAAVVEHSHAPEVQPQQPVMVAITATATGGMEMVILEDQEVEMATQARAV